MYRGHTGEDAELMAQGCSHFPHTMGSVMETFCSSLQQGCTGEQRGCRAAEIGGQGKGLWQSPLLISLL